MFQRYIVKTKQAHTLSEHFVVTDTHRGNFIVGVYHRERNAKHHMKILNGQQKRGHDIRAKHDTTHNHD